MTIASIDETRLETDSGYRFGYLAEFIGFGKDDLDAIHLAAPHLGPLAPALVDAVDDKLFSYDATKRHFVPRQSGYDGLIPEGLDALTLEYPMIAFRKQHLGRHLTRLVTGEHDAKMFDYLDMVGKIHTPEAGSPNLDVPLVLMNALLGFVATAVTQTMLSFSLDRQIESRLLRAFGKPIWIQNDLITRHFQLVA